MSDASRLFQDLFKNTLAIWDSPNWEQNLTPCGSSVVTLFENVRNKIGNGCQNAGAQAIVDYANETILMFPYASVEQHWRCLLMDGTLLLATEKFLQSPTDDLVREVIRIVDTGVVVSGAPGENRRAHADAILDALQTWLSDRHPVGPLPEPIVLSTPVPAIADKHAVPRWPAPPGFTAFSDTVANDAVPRILPQGVIDHWPARSHWPSLEYLLKLAGDRVVPVEIGSKYTDAAWQQKMICLREFVCDYVLKAEPAYLAQHDLFSQIPRLLSDIDVPEYCYCSPEPTEVYTPPDQELILNAWFGPQNTISPLHHDPYHNLLAQVVGRKYIRLYPPGAHVYPLDGIMANTSQVDVENPDLEHYPLFADAPYVECILNPGEVLYIPPKWWHYVRSLDISFSVSFWF